MGYLNEALGHLEYLAQHFYQNHEEYIVRVILLEIGIPTKGRGYDYTVDAILMYHQKSMRYMTKEIYPAVAKKHGIYVKPVQVEGAIRKAIEKAYLQRDKVWECYFPEETKPTNAEFIARMATILGFWNSCCEAQKRKKGGV